MFEKQRAKRIYKGLLLNLREMKYSYNVSRGSLAVNFGKIDTYKKTRDYLEEIVEKNGYTLGRDSLTPYSTQDGFLTVFVIREKNNINESENKVYSFKKNI